MGTNMKNRNAVQNEQVQTHIKAKGELESQVKDLKAQIEELKRVAESATVAATAATDVAAAGEASAEVEALKSQLQLKSQENEKLEMELAEERNRLAQATSEHNAALVCRSMCH